MCSFKAYYKGNSVYNVMVSNRTAVNIEINIPYSEIKNMILTLITKAIRNESLLFRRL